MTAYVSPFTGQSISPSSVGYELLTLSVNTEFSWPINGNPTTSTPVSSIVDITATVTGLLLKMPPATQVSTGQSVLVRNIGTNSFTVTDNSGNTIITVASGIAQFIFLRDNATVNGTWGSVVFGAGTSSANASALAGAGLVAKGLTLNESTPLINYFSNTTFADADRAQFAVWGGGVGTFTLPVASTVGNNWFMVIRNGGGGILNVTPTGTNTIDSNVNQQLQPTESLVVVSNGINGYSTYAYGQSAQFFFTLLSLSVTGGTITLSGSQATNLIQEYTGVLTSNQIIVLPPTVQFYAITNSTSGAFSLTFKTTAIGAATVVVPQSLSLAVICDGTNVYNATSGSSSNITALTLGNGSLAAPSLKFSGDLTTGLYLPASGDMGVVVNNLAVADFKSTGIITPGQVTALLGITGGTF